MKLIISLLILFIFFLVITLGLYYIILPMPSYSSPSFPKGCIENYPLNITFYGQTIYSYFWSKKCCSSTLPLESLKEYNVCWETERRS